MESVLGRSANRLCAIMPTLLAGSDRLHLANHIWYRDTGMTVYPAFLDACSRYYTASATPTPMDDTTRQAINAFVDEHTHGMIPDLLPFSDELAPYVDTCLDSLSDLCPLIDRLNWW